MDIQDKNSKMKNIESFLIVISFVFLATLIGYVFKIFNFSETNIVVVYILFVLLSARFVGGYLYGILSAIFSTLAYNYFFTLPYFTLKVDDFGYIITFIIMTITSIITSTLTSRVRQNAMKSYQKELEIRALYDLTNHLSEAYNIEDIPSITVKALYNLFSFPIGFLSFDEGGIPQNSFIEQVSDKRQIYREIDDTLKIKEKIKALQKEYYLSEEFCDYPIYGRDDILGVLRVPTKNFHSLKSSQSRLLHTMIETVAITMDRLREEKKRLKAKEEMTQERYRSNLLRSISHDIRTPLTAIMGSAEILMDKSLKGSDVFSYSQDIYHDAQWLKTLVENILNLTKLQEGKLLINREFETIEEIIGSAIGHLKKRALKQNILVLLPDDIVMVEVDIKLILQVFINLIDNAIKHSKDEDEIIIKVEENFSTNMVEISIIDEGDGISQKDLPHIFETFYTTDGKIGDGTKGVGLGLSICETIIHSHGGEIFAKNREDKRGAIFKFTLPMKILERKESYE